MNKDVKERLLLPILIPVGGLALIAVLVIGFAQILLSTSATAATVVALIVAIAVLVVASRISVSTTLRWGGVAAMTGAVAGVALMVGGFALATIGPPVHEGEGEEGEPGGPVIEIAAANIQFDTDALSAPASEPFVISFDNQDAGVPHNVAIYADNVNEDPTAEALFVGEIFNGPQVVDYEVEALEAGTFFFRCDVHPTMEGEIVVEEGGGPEPAPGETEPPEGSPAPEPTGGEPSGEVSAITIGAQGLAFDRTTFTLPADTPVDLTLNNQDPDLHNLTIYASADGASGAQLFFFQPFPGPATQTHRIEPLSAGTYYFQCDVHPPMNGQVTVG